MMGDVKLDFLAIVVATFATMPVGYIWYELLFKAKFNEYAKLHKADKKALAKASNIGVGVTLVSSFVSALGLQYCGKVFSGYFDISFSEAVLTCAVTFWSMFYVLRVFMHDTFELRPRQLTLIHAGYDLATLLVTAVVLGLIA
jgi:hypothetical protein